MHGEINDACGLAHGGVESLCILTHQDSPAPGTHAIEDDAGGLLGGGRRLVAKVDAALHMPMQTVPARLGELDAGQPHVLMCHHGMRSYQVAQFLKNQGFDRVFNLTGGIDAWAEEVDPGLARY